MTAIFKREFRSVLSRDAGVRPHGVSGGEFRPVFSGQVPDLRPDGFSYYTLYQTISCCCSISVLAMRDC